MHPAVPGALRSGGTGPLVAGCMQTQHLWFNVCLWRMLELVTWHLVFYGNSTAVTAVCFKGRLLPKFPLASLAGHRANMSLCLLSFMCLCAGMLSLRVTV